MALPSGQVAHVRLEVIDTPRLVGAGNILVAMREAHCADGVIVGLQDRLKVEGQTIP